MNKHIPSPKIYNNPISEINVMTGLTHCEIGRGFLLFCHWQKPNDKEKYLAIPVLEDGKQYYDLYPIFFDLEYKKTPNAYGEIGLGPALLLNVKQYYDFGYLCLAISKGLHTSEDCVFQIEEMD